MNVCMYEYVQERGEENECQGQVEKGKWDAFFGFFYKKNKIKIKL